MVHLLHLIVKAVLIQGSEKDPMVDADTCEFWNIIQKCWPILDHCSYHAKDIYLLQEKQTLTGVLEHHLLSDVSSCLVEQERALTVLIPEIGVICAESLVNQKE